MNGKIFGNHPSDVIAPVRQWWKVEVLRPLASGSNRRIELIHAHDAEEARKLAPVVLHHFFGPETYIGTVDSNH